MFRAPVAHAKTMRARIGSAWAVEVDLGGAFVDNGDIIVLDVALGSTVIPEPTSVALLGLGLTGLVIFRRRRGAAL